MIKWIFFDIGNVLIDDSGVEKMRIDLITKVAKVYNKNLTVEKVRNCLPVASAMIGNLNNCYLKCLIKDQSLAVKAIADFEAVKPELLHEYTSRPVRPEAKAVLNKLSKKYNLGLIANQPSSVRERLIDAGIYEYFTHNLVSKDHGLGKPDPKYFEAVLKHTGANPKESVFIDDNIERGLVPAKKIGMTTVWYKTYDRTDYPKQSVDYAITSLKDLLSIFDIKP